MLTLSDLVAESQAVLKLGISRVMVINNADYERESKRERESKKALMGKKYSELHYEYK